MDICRRAVQQIDEEHPEKLVDFLLLRDSDVDEIRYMCAFCLLDLARLTEEQEMMALRQADEYFAREENSIGKDIWLQDWEARKGGKQ